MAKVLSPMSNKKFSSGDARIILRGLGVQKRALGALIMRQVQIQWGRRNIGFAWIAFEPLIFAIPVLLVWSVARSRYEYGVPTIPLLWSGYLPLLAFRHITSFSLRSIRNNGAVLYHRAVTPLDIVLSRTILEICGNVCAVICSFIFFYALGYIDFPKNLPLFIFGFLFTYWWSTTIALIIAAASERTELVEHIWSPISYLYIFYSGFFYIAGWLPDSLRSVVMWIDPPLHCYEMIRNGMFGESIQTFQDPAYLAFLLAILTILGLWLISRVREHLELDT